MLHANLMQNAEPQAPEAKNFHYFDYRYGKGFDFGAYHEQDT